MMPAGFDAEAEAHWAGAMVRRVLAGEARRRRPDPDLAGRARRLSEAYLDGRARPTSVTWSARQRQRWGSATAERGAVRISERLREAPVWVLDYVLLHELAHLVAPRGHGPEFHALLARYPHHDMAEGFLRGLAYAREADPDRDRSDIAPPPPCATDPCPDTLF
jgi:hypothetical protein